MAPIVAITSGLGAVFSGTQAQYLFGLFAQQTEPPGGPTEAETRNAFLDLLDDMTELIIELMPGVDVDALGPFGGWFSNIIVLLATLLAAYAVFRLVQGLGKMYVTSGGKKEKIKEGKDMVSSALMFLAIAVGAPVVLMMITWFVTYVTG